MIRLLTVACLCAASLQMAIWSGLVSGWTTLVGSSLGDAATKLERATEPRSALTSPSDPLNRDVAAAREEIRKLKEAWRQTSAAKQKESARDIADLSAAREETRTLRARHREAEKKVSDAVEKQVQERARAEALDRDLAAARQEIQTLKVDQANAAQDASAAERTRARERARGEALAGNLAAVREENRTAVSAEIASSLRRGDALIASGDLAAARLVLRRAADAGDARAAMTLAETYDPAILEKLGVHGVVPDLAMARGWYEKAKKLGATEATQRLELLASKQH